MTSKEMEARSGVPRANIRYYEAEGLLAPARSGNGYRDYSEEDLRTLEKIKLLRRLGVTIEALRALRDGRAELSAVLDRRLAEVGGEQAALGRVERVCGDLRRTGATFTGLDPGRYLADLDAPALLGMRLAGMDGKNLPYSEGVTRYLMMLWMGLGFYIPILSLVMILRSAWRCWKEEPQPWDDGVAYTAKPFRLRYAASLILTVLLVLIVGEAVNSWSQLPPNRGDLTVAEFAENYNRQAEYLDFGGRAYLDEDGQWQEKPEDGSQIISLEDLMDVNPWDDAKAFHYTVEDGHVTAVTMSGTFQNTTAMWVETPDSYVPQIVTALVWGRREAPFWSLSRQAQLREQEEADWERGFTLHQPGVIITAEVEQTGFCYFQGMGWQPVEEGNRLSFTYTVALDNG